MHRRINASSNVEKFILENIQQYWSPDQVAGAWNEKT
jgi:IS30 family transposase